MRSELRYGAFLAYCPRGDSAEHRRSRQLISNLKSDAVLASNAARQTTEVIADLLVKHAFHGSLESILSSQATLVPAPPHGLIKGDGLWVPKNLAKALVRVGLGASCQELLHRARPVTKAATARPAQRPTASEHAESLAVQPQVETPGRIVIVDDVVTRGATLLGCAEVLERAFPDTEIVGFAAVRCISSPDEFSVIDAPVIGTIRLTPDGSTLRRP